MRRRPLTAFDHWMYLSVIAGLRLAQLALVGLAVYIITVGI